MKKSKGNFIYTVSYIFISFLFLKMLWPQISRGVFEHDILNHIPWIVRDMQKLSVTGLIGYMLAPFPWYNEIASIKIQIVSLVALFGPLAPAFTSVSIIFHFFNSWLVCCLSKKLGLSSRVGFLASLIYLTLFAHFHAYKDPMAFQHVISVFFILLGLNFYLKTDRLIDSNDRDWLKFYISTLLINFAASFCLFSIALLPAMILTHILFCPKDDRVRLRKYDMWLPLFCIYLIYPLLPIAFGHGRISKIATPIINNSTALTGFIHRLNIPAKFSILFLLGLSCLFAFRGMLVIYERYDLRRFLKKAAITVSIAIAVFLLIAGGPRRLLIPYNCLMAFVGMLASYLSPLQNALLIDSTLVWNHISLQLNSLYFLIGLGLLVVFIKNFLLQKKPLLILATWYLGSMFWLYGCNPVLSRYLVYLSPIFSIIFAAGFVYLYTQLIRSFKISQALNEIILVLVFISFCIPNVFAINLALFRGKMVNAFCLYDYARAAELIKYDLIKNNQIDELKQKRLYVNNIVPANLNPTPESPYFGRDPHNDIARFTFMQVFNDTSMDIAFNEAARHSRGAITYTLDDHRIYNVHGVNIDPFRQLLEQGIEDMRSDRYQDALSSFNKALALKPYLFDYILSDLQLDDLSWITDGDDMRTWVEKIKWGVGTKDRHKINYTAAIINKEIDDLILCLFYTSFLEYQFGNFEESKYWFSKIRLLENNFRQLYAWLSQQPVVKSKKEISKFLEGLGEATLWYERPTHYLLGRYKFEKFLLRLGLS